MDLTASYSLAFWGILLILITCLLYFVRIERL